MMGSLYAMRRANGDWFALDDHGGCRVPVFNSSRDGILARASHSGMLLFQPAALDEVALGDLGLNAEERAFGRRNNSLFAALFLLALAALTFVVLGGA